MAQVYNPLQNLAKSFRHPVDPSQKMYYTVAWDYRRDLWEQAERVYKALLRVHENTQCKVILVGHSFGARLMYTLLAVRITNTSPPHTLVYSDLHHSGLVLCLMLLELQQ